MLFERPITSRSAWHQPDLQKVGTISLNYICFHLKLLKKCSVFVSIFNEVNLYFMLNFILLCELNNKLLREISHFLLFDLIEYWILRFCFLFFRMHHKRRPPPPTIFEPSNETFCILKQCIENSLIIQFKSWMQAFLVLWTPPNFLKIL